MRVSCILFVLRSEQPRLIISVILFKKRVSGSKASVLHIYTKSFAGKTDQLDVARVIGTFNSYQEPVKFENILRVNLFFSTP